MIKQNDPQLRKEIQLYGCNLLAHLAMVRTDWSAQEIESIYQSALQSGAIDANCSVKQPNAILQLAGSALRQIGGLVLANKDTWGAKESDGRIQFKVARWGQRNSKHLHFTLFNLKGEIYDPFDARIASYSLEKEQLLGYQFYG